MDAKLKVIDGAKSTTIRLKLPTVMGRGAESSLKVRHSQVSRKHCELYEEDGLLAVFDLGSSNGTFVNGERISDPTFILPGDILRVGDVTLEAVYESPAAEQYLSGSSAEGSVARESVTESKAQPTPEPEDALAEPAPEPAASKEQPVADKPTQQPPVRPPVRKSATDGSTSAVSAIVDYSENQGGSFIAIQAIDVGDAAAPMTSSVELDTGEEAKPDVSAVSGFDLGEEAEKPSNVDGADSALNDFFRNLE